MPEAKRPTLGASSLLPPKMNPLWPACWQECRRLAARTTWRSQLWWARRRLCVAERQLGELGWQQADFDPNDRDVRELQTTEQAQARLIFEIAEQKEQIAGHKSDSDTRMVELHQQIEACEADATPSASPKCSRPSAPAKPRFT